MLYSARAVALTRFLLPMIFSNGAFDVLATLRRAGAPYILTPTELFCIAHGYFRHYDNPPAEGAEARVH